MRKETDWGWIRKTVCLVMAVGGLAASLYLMAGAVRYQTARNEYRRLAQDFDSRLVGPDTVESPDTVEFPDTPENQDTAAPTDFLQRRNPDYVFWLMIPGTSVNYPVVKSTVEGYYLNHTFEGKENPGGCLFTAADGEPLTVDNTIVYGHNMKDGSMFGDLKQYIHKEYYESHPDLWVYAKGVWRRYEIYSCQIRTEKDDTVYQSQFIDCDEKRGYLEKICGASIYGTKINPDCGDFLMTLSTCYGSGKRLIVQAVVCYTE